MKKSHQQLAFSLIIGLIFGLIICSMCYTSKVSARPICPDGHYYDGYICVPTQCPDGYTFDPRAGRCRPVLSYP